MFKKIETWDNIAYTIYNFFAMLKYILIDNFKYRKVLRNNKHLKNIHKGERCFIVLNGPSINKLDLTKLKNEYTFCSNYFYMSEHIDSINPNYYCICDSATFSDDRIEKVHDIFNKCGSATFILNKNAIEKLSQEEKKKSFFVYGMHMPSLFKIRNNLAGISSSFTNVSMFCILCASYMGFENIYVLGNDFAPGAGLTHCYGNLELEKETNEVYRIKNRVNLCTFYWSYYLAQAQSFYTEKFTKKYGVKIYNVNPESYVRAYDFADYDSLFKTDDKKIGDNK